MALRVLVVDDSVLFRRVMSDALASIPGVEVVGNAANGKLGLQRIETLQPDLVTLDVEMPEMGGLEVLDALKKQGSKVSVIMVSALTLRGGQLTMAALEKGAFDFITKPEGGSAEESKALVAKELAPRLRALINRLEIRNILRKPAGVPPSALPVPKPLPAAAPVSPAGAKPVSDIVQRMNRLAGSWRPDMIVIGVSTGGPNALAQMLPGIPKDIGVPVFIVQHMPPIFTQSLAESLSAKCRIRVKEAAHLDRPEPGVAYIAPGGKQMRIRPFSTGGMEIEVTDDPPENNCRPAVDYLFRSVANSFPGRALAVILTGMGSDGTLGLRLLKRNNCWAIAQDEATCVVYGMPKAAVEARVVDAVLPIDAVAAEIVRVTRGMGQL